MKDTITIGSVEVPLADYAVGASAILGIRDSGKTVTAKGIAEQLLTCGVPIVVFDAVGKWRWMKVPGDHSRGKGYKVVVAGGRGPDLPLNPHSVPEIVRSALKERIPLIIDLYEKNLSKSDWRQIVKSAIHIIHYENEGGAVHVFLEEAAEFVPQKVYDGDTYAEVEKLVRMGGNASVGITLINQRSQEVNKAVLDNCSTALVLGCQVGKNAIEAVEKWIDRLDPATAKEVTTSLPKLQSGEAWVWTRKSLDRPSREKIAMCRSMHPDRRTPEVVLASAKPTDTAEFVAKMASAIPKVIEDAKANDPAELKKEIAALKRMLGKRLVPIAPNPPVAEIEMVSVLDESDRNKISALLDYGTQLEHDLKNVSVFLTEIRAIKQRFDVIVSNADRAALKASKPALMKKVKEIIFSRKPSEASSNGESLPSGEKRCLIAAAKYNDGITKQEMTILTGFKRSTRDAYILRLKTRGYVDENGDKVLCTQAGLDALGSDYEPLPTGQELIDYWRGKLPSGEAKIFEVALAAYPQAVTRESLEDATGFKRSTRDAYILRMCSRRVIESVGRGEIRAAEELFQ